VVAALTAASTNINIVGAADPPGNRSVTFRRFLFILGSSLAAIAAAAAGDATEPRPPPVARTLYAVNESATERGSISVYDIDAGHRLIRTIATVAGVADVRGVAASAVTGRLYVAYLNAAGVGMGYCLDLYTDKVLWNRAIPPGVDRLAIRPDGRLLYVPTYEEGSAEFINIVDAATGEPVRRVYFSNRSHDAQYPLSGPIFQETKATDGSGNYLYRIDPQSYAVKRVGPYSGVLGPYAVDGASRYAVSDVYHLWGMAVTDLVTGRIVTARVADHPPGDPGLLHGIGWTPDQREVWQNSTQADPHVYVWDMRDPMAPVLKDRLTLRSGRGSHWLTFDIKGDFAYVAPNKKSADRTEIFDPRTHASLGTIGGSEDLLEIDFANGKIIGVGDQYGIGRR
jgi:DNA-binding beta-propeller fold protein YncE